MRLATGVSESPIVNGIDGVLMSINVFVGEIVEITGERFAGSTVTENMVLFDFAPVSLTHRVIAEEPDCAPAVTFTVRFAPVPAITMLAGAIRLGSEDDALIVKFVAGS